MTRDYPLARWNKIVGRFRCTERSLQRDSVTLLESFVPGMVLRKPSDELKGCSNTQLHERRFIGLTLAILIACIRVIFCHEC